MSIIHRKASAILLFLVGGFALTTQARAWDRAPASPAIAPGGSTAPSQEGRSGIEGRNVYLCPHNGQVIRIEYGIQVSKSATVNTTSVGLVGSAFSFGVGGNVGRTEVRPNLPESEFNILSERERNNAIITCESLKNNVLYQSEVLRALSARKIQDRGDMTGMAATHALQQAYNALERANPLHPKLSAARAAARLGWYEEAISLLSSH
jgi:hypothetical protein